MGIKNSFICLAHDEGYGDDLLRHINNSIGGKDMFATAVVDLNSEYQYASFDDWYQEFESFSMRAERLLTKADELRAAFEAGRLRK